MAEAINPTAVTIQQIETGIIQSSRSIAEAAIKAASIIMEVRYISQPPRRNKSTPGRRFVRKYKINKPIKTRAVSNSITKYRGEIGALQYLHFRPKSSQETSGILS